MEPEPDYSSSSESSSSSLYRPRIRSERVVGVAGGGEGGEGGRPAKWAGTVRAPTGLAHPLFLLAGDAVTVELLLDAVDHPSPATLPLGTYRLF